VELLAAGHDVHVLDNFCNSERQVLDRICAISGQAFTHTELDLLDYSGLSSCMHAVKPDAVIHFAALKSVSESVADPHRYYQNNVTGTLNLLRVMAEEDCNVFVFSSSATVYGQPDICPVNETAPTRPSSPYGKTKLIAEWMIADQLAAPGSRLRAGVLRYFNPVGAHSSGLIGELPRGIPNNLAPYVAQTAAGLREAVKVFGDDYPTPDGTGVRDYIHVVDLAQAHVKALDALTNGAASFTVNIGTGRAYSVLELIEEFGRAAGRPVPYERVARRPGDVAECWADPALAKSILGWEARRGLAEICEDAWRWQSCL